MNKLGICITSYNRPNQAITLITRLASELNKVPGVKFYLYVDAGKPECIDVYKAHREYLESINCQVTISDTNQGAFRAKYFNLYKAANECEYITHCDDDDWLSGSVLKHFLQCLLVPDQIGILQYNCVRMSKTLKGYTSRFKIQAKSGVNALCLNGMILRSERIKSQLEEYKNCHLFSLTNKRDVWGDDILIPSFLSQGLTDEQIILVDEVLCTQVYIEGEDHLCFDPEVKKFTSKDKKPFVRVIKLHKKLHDKYLNL